MGSAGLEWDAEDAFTSTRGNQKTNFIGTGAQINALSTTYAGQTAYCTSTGNGFTIDKWYTRDAANTTWIEGVNTGSDIDMDAGIIYQNLFTKKFDYDANANGVNPFTLVNVTGTGTDNGIIDGINDGRQLQAGATSSDWSTLTLNNIRNFDPANCVIFGIMRRDTASTESMCGISSLANYSTGSSVSLYDYSANTYKRLWVVAGGSGGGTNTDVAIDTAWTPFKIVCTSANQKLYTLVSSIWTLKVTQSTTLPTVACQPFLHVFSASNGTRTTSMRRLLVLNTV